MAASTTTACWAKKNVGHLTIMNGEHVPSFPVALDAMAVRVGPAQRPSVAEERSGGTTTAIGTGVANGEGPDESNSVADRANYQSLLVTGYRVA